MQRCVCAGRRDSAFLPLPLPPRVQLSDLIYFCCFTSTHSSASASHSPKYPVAQSYEFSPISFVVIQWPRNGPRAFYDRVRRFWARSGALPCIRNLLILVRLIQWRCRRIFARALHFLINLNYLGFSGHFEITLEDGGATGVF